MTDFAAARHNMVESQLRPSRVLDPRLIAAMAETPRELFVPKPVRGIAYVDEDIAIAPGRYLMEPMVFARMVQEAAISDSHLVLDVGCGTGYSTVVLARMAAQVVAVEADAVLADKASQILGDLEVGNAVVVKGDLAKGNAGQGPYDVILVEGCLPDAPEALLAQLADGGRLLAVVLRDGVGRATLFSRQAGLVGRHELFDAAVPPLPGFVAKVPAFQF